MSARGRAGGFTLLEMLVVVLFTGIVLSFAAGFYLDLSRASSAALYQSSDLRRATRVLDRVTRDLEAATLVKKPDKVDPLAHPWLFLAEARGMDGADRLRFQARNHRPRGPEESDLVQIAYWLVAAQDGDGFDLLRWSSAQPPVAPLDRDFPRRGEPGVELLVSHVAAFAVRLQDKDGTWQSAWDSASPAQADLLPLTAEVRLALLPDPARADAQESEPLVYSRPVVFALDPIDLEKILTGKDDQDQSQKNQNGTACVTVSECVSRNQAAVQSVLEQNPQLQNILDSIGDQCWSDHAAQVPFAVTNCN